MDTLEQSDATTMAQVAQIGQVEAGMLELAQAEIQQQDLPWSEAYGEYQSGGWHTVSLYSETGQADDVLIRDCRAVPTQILSAMPSLSKLVDSLGLDIMWARLARQSANSFLFEHVDYTELCETRRHRIHIPITTNTSCSFSFGGRSTHLSSGHIWRLSPVRPHGSCNLYGPDRIHLIVDCYENDALWAMMASEKPADHVATELPDMSEGATQDAFEQACKLYQLGFAHTAERLLLQLFFHYRMEPGMGYELVARLYAHFGDTATSDNWMAKRTVMLGLLQ